MWSEPRATINVLQAGRALAALAVVAHHSAQAAEAFGSAHPLLSWLDPGYLGVDFFFVLSGFIIYHSTVRGKALGEYASARLKRVLLPYLPIGIGIALVYTFLPSMTSGLRSWDWLATMTLVPVGAPALSVAWTLQHEMTFYAIFALLYFGRVLWAGLAVWAALIAFTPIPGIPFATINLEFIMGILAARLYHARAGHWLLLPAAAAVALVWFALGAHRDQSIIIGLVCAMAILQLALIEAKGGLKVPAHLTFIGAASYAIYLVHNVTISVIARIVPDEWPIILGTGIAASVIVGVAYFLLVEKPLLRLASWSSARPAKTVTVG